MSKRKKTKTKEQDSVFFLKLLLYVILGSTWLRIIVNDQTGQTLSLPLGLMVGLIIASHDHFRIDRKIEYAVLLIAALFSAYIPTLSLVI